MREVLYGFLTSLAIGIPVLLILAIQWEVIIPL